MNKKKLFLRSCQTRSITNRFFTWSLSLQETRVDSNAVDARRQRSAESSTQQHRHAYRLSGGQAREYGVFCAEPVEGPVVQQ